MGGLHGGEALGGSHEVHRADVLAAARLEGVDGVDGGAARGEHRVDDDDDGVIDIRGHLAVVLTGLVRHLVALHANEAHVGGGQQGEHAVDEADASADDGDDGDEVVLEHREVALADGRLHLGELGGQVARHLVGHEHGDLVEQGAEVAGVGLLAAHPRQLVLDQGVVEHVHFAHRDILSKRA